MFFERALSKENLNSILFTLAIDVEAENKARKTPINLNT